MRWRKYGSMTWSVGRKRTQGEPQTATRFVFPQRLKRRKKETRRRQTKKTTKQQERERERDTNHKANRGRVLKGKKKQTNKLCFRAKNPSRTQKTNKLCFRAKNPSRTQKTEKKPSENPKAESKCLRSKA